MTTCMTSLPPTRRATWRPTVPPARAASAPSTAPASGSVVVELTGPGNQKAELGRFTTDVHGSGAPRLHMPDWATSDCTLRVVASTPRGTEIVERKVKLVRSWQVMLSSDKPVYQP